MTMDLDALLEKEIKREKYREEYNARPDVKEKRKEYNKIRQAQSKVARRLLSGEIDQEKAKEELSLIAVASSVRVAGSSNDGPQEDEGKEEDDD